MITRGRTDEDRQAEISREAEQKRVARCYFDCFGTDAGREVLKDLRAICYYDEPIIFRDEFERNMAEGARMVFLRILDNLKYNEREDIDA